MITGRVNWRREAIVTISIRDLIGDFRAFQCVLDTGYDGDIALPSNVIDQLGLVPSDNLRVILGNGEHVFMRVYSAVASWHEQLVNVEVLQTNGESVIGMALLENNTLTVQVWDGGEVVIEPR